MKNKGFSMIELIIAVLIIGILATASIMGLSVVYYSDSEKAARELCNTLNSARNKAVVYKSVSGEQIVAGLSKEDDGHYYAWIYKVNDAGEPVEDEEPIEKTKLAAYSISISASRFAPGDVGYSPGDEVNPGVFPSGSLVFSYKKGIGSLNETKIGGSATSSPLLNLFIRGAEEYRLIIAPASGRCYMYENP